MENTDKKILIVDDDEMSRSLLRQALNDCTQIYEAADGVEALAFLQRNPDTALVFLDVLMPRMDGMELLLRIRLSPMLRDLPVIMLSASPEEDMNYRGLSLGATRFVYKPYRTALLREMANQLLETSRKEVEIEPGSMDEFIFARSQALDSGILALVTTNEGELSTVYYTPAYAKFCGYTVQEYEALVAAGTDLSVTIAHDHFDSFRMSVGMIAEEQMPLAFYLHVQRQDRQLLTLSCLGQYFGMDGNQPVVCLIAETQELESERNGASDMTGERLDRLTGIATREAFFSAARRFLDENDGEKCLMVTCDADRFKIINDVYGTRVGDSILVQMAASIFRETLGRGVCGRLRADVFAFCVREEDFDLDSLLESQRFLSDNLGLAYNLVIHNGIYPITEPSAEISVMCDRADLARSTIKGDYSKRYAYYDEPMRAAILAEQEILNDMEAALETGEFVLYLQPIYSLNFEKAVSAEALVRWNHPEKGIIEPGRFISLFEHNRFITNLDHYMWELTCRYLAERRDQGLAQIPISVNVSRVNLFQTDLASDLLEILGKYDLTPAMLRLEITETAYMDDPAQLIMASEKLRKAGFKIMVDDFGSGYSSLHMLKDIPLDVLKLDMRFLSNVEPSSKAATILLGVIRIAQSLGMVTVAEGVETLFELEFLRSAGCDNIQGFYYSKPLPIDEFEVFLDSSPVI
ncbi:MAG: EAL domain-containing protein [Schwartzia sp.]|nr:EAL domain-containing protein [Schwartzia sp. (in: firmicutes)]